MSDENLLLTFDHWLADDGPAAVVLRQWLLPVEGPDAVIFPPTYPPPEVEDSKRPPYNVDFFPDGASVCQIDSVGSQANRIEPRFKRDPYRALVPQVTIRVGSKTVHLLEAGHRAADAVVRYSTLWQKLEPAFRAIAEEGDAEPLARIAPTSIVFGVWDSRATQVKLPRIVRSVIRAHNVRVLNRSAVYIPPADYVGQEVLEPPESKERQDVMSELGLSHAPATWTHGGVLVCGEIRREAALSLAAVRALASKEPGRSLVLQRYILGLSLVAFTVGPDLCLRQGCELVPDPERPPQCKLVLHDGRREDFNLTHREALSYATAAAEAFGVGPDLEGEFSAESAKAALSAGKEERKRSRRRG